MNQFLFMDIFFIISAIGFVVLFVVLAVVGFYAVQLMRTLNQIAVTVEEEAVALKGDLDAARASMKRGGLGLLSLFGFMGTTSKRLLSKKRRSS